MIILGIETSCDDTCAALLEIKHGKFNVLSNIISSQAKLHQKYGGVVPEMAARKHIENIIPVIEEALKSGRRGRIQLPPSFPRRGQGVVPDAIAVTVGPGLITSLLVGVETAKALAFAWNKPLIGVNHIEGHIYSPLLPASPVRRDAINRVSGSATYSKTTDAINRVSTLEFPAIALIVSGGHTELILIKNHGRYKLLGRTRDDAAGECFDKAAKMLGLGFPGGPLISKLAEKGNPAAFLLPRPMTADENFEFSFSGLKNAIRLLIEKTNKLPSFLRRGQGAGAHPLLGKGGGKGVVPDIAASIEQTIVDILIHKSLLAVRQYNPKSFILAGGVSANKKLRQTLSERLPKSIKFLLPAQEYTQDNAAMIASAAYFHYNKKDIGKPFKLSANANWELV